jgi:hypothetical protein
MEVGVIIIMVVFDAQAAARGRARVTRPERAFTRIIGTSL